MFLIASGMRVGADKKQQHGKWSPNMGAPPPIIYAFSNLNGFASISEMMVLVQKSLKSADRRKNLIPVDVRPWIKPTCLPQDATLNEKWKGDTFSISFTADAVKRRIDQRMSRMGIFIYSLCIL